MLIILLIMSDAVMSQTFERPKPFGEADKAIAALENEPIIRDSLRRSYQKHWLIGVSYGQRFISANNRSDVIDSITNVDFTSKRAFYGLGVGYHISKRLYIGLDIEFLILPKTQEIVSFSGGTGSGQGGGGLLLGTKLSGKYFFHLWKYSSIYTEVSIGRERIIARGGEVTFSFSSGRQSDINSLDANLLSGSLAVGIAHRMSPVSMIDFNLGYVHTSFTGPIGGITSPGGLSSSLSLIFFIKPKNE
ncbi:MAG: hypothetical protein AAFQ94_18115 [Bacteroidota bacterium]